MQEIIPTSEQKPTDSEGSQDKKSFENRTSLGWKLMIVGSVIGFISCVITILDLAPDFRGLCLYGLTTLGVILAFTGCYLVMER
jgi:hypothetical protein